MTLPENGSIFQVCKKNKKVINPPKLLLNERITMKDSS